MAGEEDPPVPEEEEDLDAVPDIDDPDVLVVRGVDVTPNLKGTERMYVARCSHG